jgi:glycosyltransferase involved in cell wall biosynthesis
MSTLTRKALLRGAVAERRIVYPPVPIKTFLLSVIIPVYNEERTVKELVRRVLESPIDKEVVIVDDASSDRTPEILEKEIAPHHANVRVLRHPENRGKGSAIRTGLEAVRGDVVLIQDADLEYNPAQYPALVEPIIRGETDVVYGSRFTNVNPRLFMWEWFLSRCLGRQYEIRYLHHFLGIQVLNLLANVLYRAGTTDEATCYKVVRTSVMKGVKLRCTGFEFCPELTAKLRKQGYRITEVPIEYHPRSHNEGKKLNWGHGFEAIWTLIRYRFTND